MGLSFFGGGSLRSIVWSHGSLNSKGDSVIHMYGLDVLLISSTGGGSGIHVIIFIYVSTSFFGDSLALLLRRD